MTFVIFDDEQKKIKRHCSGKAWRAHARAFHVGKNFFFSKLQKMLENPKISETEFVDFFDRIVAQQSFQRFGITNNAPHFVNVMPKNEE